MDARRGGGLESAGWEGGKVRKGREVKRRFEIFVKKLLFWGKDRGALIGNSFLRQWGGGGGVDVVKRV